MRILVYTNLWPSSAVPTHGSFIEERWRRIVDRTGWSLRVVHPLPRYPRVPGRGLAAQHARLPRYEEFGGTEIEYPRYWHVPRFGTAKHAERMRRGTRKSFARLVREFSPDLVDVQYLWPDACAAIPLAVERRLPVLATARGSDVNVLPEHPHVRREMRRILPKATRLLAVSPALARSLASLLDLGAGQVVVAPNGVDVGAFRCDAERSPGRVICVARLLPGKALPLLVEALAAAKGGPFRELVLVGGGPLRPELEALARQRGVGEALQFRGELARDEVAAELARASLFAFPSRREGWPNAVLEALASGLPVVACGIGGIPDIGRGCQAVRLLPLEADGAAWGRAITEELQRLGSSAELLRAAARKRAEELQWDVVLGPLISVYEAAVLQERRDGA